MPKVAPASGAARLTAAAIGLIEREQELRRIYRALTLARAGDGSLVILEGPAGIGKSELLGAAGQAARDHGTEVLQARGIDLEQHAPFGVAASLLGDAVQRLAERDRAGLFDGPARAARWVVDPRVPAPAEPHALTRGLFALTVNLARPAGLAVLVDDVQWADRPSMAFLAYLGARLTDLPIALVLAVRTGEPLAAPAVLQAIRQEPQCTVIAPPPLTEAAVGQVIREELPNAEPEFVAACARASGGNPYFCRELVSALREEGVAPTATSAAVVERHVPDSVLRGVLLRLARLGDAAAELAAAAAILDDGATLRHAATLARLTPRAAEEAADALVAGGFLAPVEPLRFAHPLIATAIRADRPPFARSRAHRTAADILHADGAPTQEIAAHLLLARPDGEPWTVEVMRAAGHQALVAGDPQGAVRLLSRALDEPPPASERPQVLIELAEAKALHGSEGAEDLVAEAVGLLDDGQGRAGALRALSRIRLATGDHAAASEALRPVLAGLAGEDPERQQILAEYLTLNTFRARLWPEAERLLSPIVEAARAGSAPEHPGLLAHVALRLAFAGERPETLRDLASRAGADDALVDVDIHGMLAGILVQALCCVDELELAEQVAGAAAAAAADRGAFFAAAAAAYHRAIPLAHRGAFAEALTALDAALVPSREGWTGAQAWPASLQAHVHLARGDIAAARDSLAALSAPRLPTRWSSRSWASRGPQWRSRRMTSPRRARARRRPVACWPTSTGSIIRGSSRGAGWRRSRPRRWAI